MTTPLDALIDALARAADYNPATETPPDAVLWCDERREFAPLLPALRARLPQLLTYGTFDAETRMGPAVWLRAAAAGALLEVALPDGAVPVVYIPGASREVLRAAEDCPPLLRPLVWFAVAGNFFGHVNGKDWTLRGFLAAERGPLRLDVPDDEATRTALGHAAVRLFATRLEDLRGKRLDVDALHALLAPDLAADMLDWLEGGLDAKADPARFAAFVAQAKKEFGFDPAQQSPHDGAVELAAGTGRWTNVWNRLAASNGLAHPNVVWLLENLEPADLLADRDAYPRLNRRGEEALRVALLKLAELADEEARSALRNLDGEHAWRRATIWAKRGEAPLAQALAQLVEIAKSTPLPTHDAAELAEAYTTIGWRADLAAVEALAAAPRALDREAVTAALRKVYLPWVEAGAVALQELARAGKVAFSVPGAAPEADTLLFVDGLRMDLAHRLMDLIEAEGAHAKLGWCWSGFPTVTATCKPLASPVAARLKGASAGSDLYPITKDGRPARKPVLDKALAEAGWSTTPTLLPEGRLWSEAGSFDEQGHAVGARMAEQVKVGLRDVADRVMSLARAGRQVRIVTDHGWLLVPGGLEVAPLDPGLVEPQGKRSRCAHVKPAASTTYLRLPWSWSAEVHVAVATGARAFLGGQEYAHGGVSPQECVLPVIEVAPSAPLQEVEITKASWEGLRLRVVVAGGADLHADLRLGSGTSGDSLAKGGRVLDEEGRTSMLVSDQFEGQEACLVVLDEEGSVVASRALRVGNE
jgi:hypothetical protein